MQLLQQAILATYLSVCQCVGFVSLTLPCQTIHILSSRQHKCLSLLLVWLKYYGGIQKCYIEWLVNASNKINTCLFHPAPVVLNPPLSCKPLLVIFSKSGYSIINFSSEFFCWCIRRLFMNSVQNFTLILGLGLQWIL